MNAYVAHMAYALSGEAIDAVATNSDDCVEILPVGEQAISSAILDTKDVIQIVKLIYPYFGVDEHKEMQSLFQVKGVETVCCGDVGEA